MSTDDQAFFDSMDEETLKELRLMASHVEREHTVAKGKEQVDPARREYYHRLSEALAEQKVGYDFDIAHHRMIFVLLRPSDKPETPQCFDIIPFSSMREFIKRNVPPEALAAAIKAGLIAPKFFRFWEEWDADEDYSDEFDWDEGDYDDDTVD